jgi:succinate dehydrogenase/fumarate reductase cytochrome b subunit
MLFLSSGVKALLVYVAVIALSMLLMGRICLDKIQIAELKAQQAELFVKFLQQTADMLTLKTELENTIQARINVQKQLEELIAANSSTSTLAIVGTVLVSVVAIGLVCFMVHNACIGIALMNSKYIETLSTNQGVLKEILINRNAKADDAMAFLMKQNEVLMAKEHQLQVAIIRLECEYNALTHSVYAFTHPGSL